MENLEVYLPFKVAASLGSPLPAPPETFAYIAISLDQHNIENFLGCYNSQDKAEEAFAAFVLDELELLDADAPWMNISYPERATMSLRDYVLLYCKRRDAWVRVRSHKDIIKEFYGNYFTIKKVELN